ncbi:hypothetical protein Tco_0204755 [Tanacetum coccineum]
MWLILETLEDAEKSQLKMNEFQKDEKVQELKIQPIDYEKLNKLYFVPQKELSEISQNDVYLDEIENQNDLLKDQLLEASLTADIKNLVITSCMEIRNKDLHDEIERISKESNDVSFEVTQGLSKRIVELEKDLSKSEAKSIAFEIALQHKSRENNSLKTVQKENENFMASLQLENAHLKQTYKDLFESVQRSKVETNQCDEVKAKEDFDEIETRNIELEHRVASLIEENEHLKLTYKNLFDSIKKSRVQTKTSNVTQNEAENLKSQLFEFAETKFKNILGKIEFFKKKQLDISELNKGSGENVCDNAKCELQTKIVELEKVLTQQTKDFNDVKLELSNRTAKFEAYFEKLEKTKVVLERQLARKSVQTKFDKHSILGKPPADKLLINSQISKSWFTPKVDVQKSLSKPVTTQSLPKNEKDQLLKRIAYLESKLASQDIRSCQKEYHELRTSYNALKIATRALNHQVIDQDKGERLEIGKCNGRISPGKTQREPTFQVVLDALALTPCYSAFLTTVDVLEVYMHQFRDSIHKHDTSYRFRMDKKKKFYLNLETFRDIFQICPRVHGQDFDELPIDEVIMSFFKELGHTGEIKSLSGKTTGLDKLHLSRAQILWGMDDYLINTLIFVFTNEESQIYGAQLPESMTSPKMRESKAYKTYLGYSTGVTPPKKTRKFKEPASSKLTTVPTSPKEPTKKDTHNVSISKKNTPAKANRGNSSGSSGGADFKSEVPDESTAKSSDINEGTCVKPGVPDVSNADSFKSDNKLWGDSDDDNESEDNKIDIHDCSLFHSSKTKRDQLGKFNGKADEGFFVRYFVVSKAMNVFNKRTRIVEETLNIRFLENAPNVTGNGPDWLFNVDSLSKSMNYVPVIVENQTNGIAGKRDNIVAGQAKIR